MTNFQRPATPENFCHDMARLYQAYKIYPVGNEHLRAAMNRAAETIRLFGSPIRLSRMGEDVVLEDTVMVNPPKSLQRMLEAFGQLRWESVRFGPDIGEDGLIKVLSRLTGSLQGPYSTKGFSAGSLHLEGENPSNKLLNEGAGYLQLMPMVQELLSDVRSAKRGSWTRAHDVVRTLCDYLISGEDLFGAVRELKDYDEYTFTHALNVSLLSAAMARTMQAPDHIVDAIAMGGLCHDLGKQKIPAEILRKPEKLTEEERAIMDRHPLDGAAKILLVPGGCPPLVGVIAFEHHMRPNGSGYPRLPIQHTPHPASLLTSVADTYDALRTVRPYQQIAFSLVDALSILIAEAQQGKLHSVFVSVFARLLNVVTPGRWVMLSDGNRAMILSPGEFDALQPLVETEHREILDLSLPNTPQIVSLEELSS